jgi:RNA polymerase sigma-70 factor, ECF subfamily
MEVPPNGTSDVAQILQRWSEGDREAPPRLMPLVYEELQARAAECLRPECPDHTLQPSVLVHQAYLKLADQNRATWKNRAHFRTVAASLMRRILVQHAREHNSQKRGGKWEKANLDETGELGAESMPGILVLDEVLERFGLSYPRESTVAEMKFFGGMETKEIAEMLNVSEKTVLRDWSFAKAWLSRELTRTS